MEKDEAKGRILKDGLLYEIQQSINYQENMVYFNRGFCVLVIERGNWEGLYLYVCIDNLVSVQY